MVEAVRNNKILDIFLEVEPTVFSNGLDMGYEMREESRIRIKVPQEDCHGLADTLLHSLWWSPLRVGCVCTSRRLPPEEKPQIQRIQ